MADTTATAATSTEVTQDSPKVKALKASLAKTTDPTVKVQLNTMIAIEQKKNSSKAKS